MTVNSDRREILHNIQGARAIAALAVVAYHLGALPFGQCGVDVFFVISGFIMSYVAPSEGSRFFARRLLRVLPLYWISTIGIYIIAILKPHWLNSTTAGLGYLAKSLLFIPYTKQDGHWGPLNLNGWTLEYEMFFYLVISWALCVFRPRWATTAAALGLVAYCVTVALAEPSNLVIRYLGQPFLLEFCLGVLAYFIVQSRIVTCIPRNVWLAIAALSLLAMPMFFYSYGAPDKFVRTLAYGVPSFLFITSLIAVEQAGWATRGRLVARLGAASYAIYLLHPYVVGVFKKSLSSHADLHSWSGIVGVFAVMILVCAVGDICHRFVERPLLKILNRIHFAGRGQRVAAE
ncbi:acyltransferase [Paraburkholderia sp. Ac-20340]|uniref:acyltransferase family protein n=1 Tax=Paraburkholderia sp. Ac-20340 TaxID=2703888 RepID=UPI0019806CB0|nr:acyltransferase [Paraburkholderia sp. Ac-20340]MBN3854635.1 acyltransferase [Paraburkholderia sp. Ac-20340]